MLQAMRERVTGILGWIIIGLVIMTFALFGLGSYLQDKSRVYAAKVNGVEISPAELQQAYQQQLQQMQQMLGDAFDPATMDEKALRKKAVNSLIQQQLILQEAENQGMVISDAYLASFIHAIPELQEDGVFSGERYKRLLFQRGIPSAEFENDLRRRLMSAQLVQGLTETAFATAGEVQNTYLLQYQKRDFDYLTVSRSSFLDKVEVSPQEIEAYYNDHKQEFKIPEKVRLAYLRLSKADLADTINIEEQALRDYYEERKQTLKKQEQRRASHILVQVSPDADKAALAAARRKAEKLLEKARAGESFEALAKENSDDPGSAARGGDLGYFARGAMVPEFDRAVFAMKPGDISDLVKSQFGYHIIKLADIKASKVPTFGEARAEIEKELKNREAEDIYYDQLEQLTDLSYEHADSLQPAADALGLDIRTEEWLTRGVPEGLGKYPKVMAAAFGDDVLEAGNNSEPLEISADEAVVIRVTDRQPESLKPLDEVRDNIVAALKQKKAVEMATSKGKELLEKARADTALEKLEDKPRVTHSNAGSVLRTAPALDRDLLQKVFRMRKSAADKAVVDGFQLANGDFAVVRLKAVESPDPASIPQTELTGIKRGLTNMYRSAALANLVEQLRNRAEIEIPSEQ